MRFLFFLIATFLLSSCAGRKVVDLRSPCVSRNGGPCERRYVNTWLKSSDSQRILV